MSHAGKDGVLLVNTGSTSAPTTKATRAYLNQFLSDPRIIDLPAWKRWLIVKCFILPFRPKRTAAAYQAVWTDRGSPLLAISEGFRDALQAALPEKAVAIGMAYGQPSVPSAVDALIAQQVRRIIVVPMFPQYASATTGSVLSAVYEYATTKWNVPMISALPPFYDDEDFLDAWKEVAGPALAAFKPDHVLLSYHGLPERQLKRCDPSGSHCLQRPDCCSVAVEANRMCYGRHCTVTSQALVKRLGLEEGKYTIAYQSRLGRDPWLSPATDETIGKLAEQGVKRLAVLSPAFVADCLETLEEIAIGGQETFHHHGGKDYLLVPSLNTHPKWVETLAKLVRAV
jgi:ferrochelatase